MQHWLFTHKNGSVFKVFFLFMIPSCCLTVSLILLLTSNGQVLFFYTFPLTNATFYSYNCNLEQNSIEYHYDQTKRCTVLFKVKPHCGEAIHSNEQSCRHCALKFLHLQRGDDDCHPICRRRMSSLWISQLARYTNKTACCSTWRAFQRSDRM